MNIEKRARKKSDFLFRAWNGEIPRWKAIVLVNVGGYLLTEITSFAVGVVLFKLRQAGFPIRIVSIVIIQLTLLFLFSIFNVRCLWIAASASSHYVKQALTKLWILAYCSYISYIAYVMVHLLGRAT